MNENSTWKLMNEIGKLPTKGQYYISDKGELYSTHTKRILKPQVCHKGYQYIEIGRKKFKIHRLVGKYFIPNPNNLPQINRKDCNKLNNCVDNLEWCDNKYNYEYSIKNGTFSKEFLKYKGNHKLIWKRYYEKKKIAELKDKEPLG